MSWSRYELDRSRTASTCSARPSAPSALKPGTLKNVGWDGSEIVAFRLHLPSRILEHNARDLETNEPTGIHRGNILGWEQHLADRLDGKPVDDRGAHGQPVDPLSHAVPVRGRLRAAVLTLVLPDLVDDEAREGSLRRVNSQAPTSNSKALPSQLPSYGLNLGSWFGSWRWECLGGWKLELGSYLPSVLSSLFSDRSPSPVASERAIERST